MMRALDAARRHGMIRTLASLLAAFALAPAVALAAAPIDGTRPLVCHGDDVASCDDATDTCQQGDPSAVNLPDSLTVDFAAKQASRVLPDGTKLVSAIGSTTRVEGSMAIQGSEAGVGWTLLVDEATGKMTIAVARASGGIIVFGHCHAE